MSNITALIAATAALVIIPGPNAALIVATSLRYGVVSGLLTVGGTTIGVGAQLVLIIAGTAGILALAGSALGWIKWLGVAYLLWLGIRSSHGRAHPENPPRGPSNAPLLWWRSVGLAVINPKTLLFNAAFLPQFVSETSQAAEELMVLSAVFLLVLLVGDSLWALGAASLRTHVERYESLGNKLTGGFLVGAGVGLALARRPD